MTSYKFQYIKFTLLLLTFTGFLSASLPTFVLAQQLIASPLGAQTPAPTTALFITVVTDEPQINVRMGPSSTIYPIVGILITGSTAPALGRSQGGDWIQIEFPSAPGGKGWVYSPLVQVSPPGNLQIVEPPPTPVPPITSTIDPTFAAQFVVVPTNTRLPTFTAQPSLTPLATFASETASSTDSIPWATIIIAFVTLGLIGFLLSLIRR